MHIFNRVKGSSVPAAQERSSFATGNRTDWEGAPLPTNLVFQFAGAVGVAALLFCIRLYANHAIKPSTKPTRIYKIVDGG